MSRRLKTLMAAMLPVLLCAGIKAQQGPRPAEVMTPAAAERGDNVEAEGTPVLVWIKKGQIVGIGLNAGYKDKRLLEGARRASATLRGNRLLLTFQGPLDEGRLADGKRAELKAAEPIQFEPETSYALGTACGCAAGTYRVADAMSARPTVEISLVQQARAHRLRATLNDECDPFGHRLWRSIFRD